MQYPAPVKRKRYQPLHGRGSRRTREEMRVSTERGTCRTKSNIDETKNVSGLSSLV